MKRLIPWAKPAFNGNEKKYLLDAFESNWVSGGPYVDKFEKKFLTLNNAENGTCCSNGTAALHLALLSLELKKDDEIIVPSFCFAAAANMVLLSGAKAVYAETDTETWCISVDSIKRCITKKTRAIIAVHNYGNLCDMAAILKTAKNAGILVIEDAAEAVFSTYAGKKAGTLGDIGCFSFQATKTITTGEGGFIITKHPDLYKKMLLIKNHGMKRPNYYWHETIAHNFRMSNLQAAIGYAQLENIEKILKQRHFIYQNYYQNLSGETCLQLQAITPKTDPVIWVTALKLECKNFKGNRDFIIESLLESGIETRPGFHAFSDMPPYYAPSSTTTLALSKNILLLPAFSGLSQDDISFICRQLLALKN